jgi:hypothetical protein
MWAEGDHGDTKETRFAGEKGNIADARVGQI